MARTVTFSRLCNEDPSERASHVKSEFTALLFPVCFVFDTTRSRFSAIIQELKEVLGHPHKIVMRKVFRFSSPDRSETFWGKTKAKKKHFLCNCPIAQQLPSAFIVFRVFGVACWAKDIMGEEQRGAWISYRLSLTCKKETQRKLIVLLIRILSSVKNRYKKFTRAL